ASGYWCTIRKHCIGSITSRPQHEPHHCHQNTWAQTEPIRGARPAAERGEPCSPAFCVRGRRCAADLHLCLACQFHTEPRAAATAASCRLCRGGGAAFHPDAGCERRIARRACILALCGGDRCTHRCGGGLQCLV